EIDNLQVQVNEQQTLLSRQTREVNMLKTDVTYLETIARDRLDRMKEGETIFRLEPARAAKAKAASSARRQDRSPAPPCSRRGSMHEGDGGRLPKASGVNRPDLWGIVMRRY